MDVPFAPSGPKPFRVPRIARFVRALPSLWLSCTGDGGVATRGRTSRAGALARR